ncbi:hypothetical protein ANO11243_095670 [Dothideomycetidae sp. 11243]|nr:hypothetical protein ANO11243_095670 [fungal sp. No.11243]
MDTEFKEGTIPFAIPSVRKPCFTYYKIAGDLDCGKPPIICLHGGPGGTHRLMVDFAELWPRYGHPVILYDMIGCGQSTNLDDEKGADESFWTVSLFVDELNNLVDHFKLNVNLGFHIIGASFGSVLGADFATTQPQGLRRLVLGCPAASGPSIVRGLRSRIDELPAEHQQVINDAVMRQRFGSKAFKTAYRAFARYAVCRAEPFPAVFERSIQNVDSPSTGVVLAMRGPCVFGTKLGSLREWDVTDRLNQITAKTLLWHGEYDHATDDCVRPLFERIPRVRWYTFPGSGHVVTYESRELREACLTLTGDFLSQVEADVDAQVE